MKKLFVAVLAIAGLVACNNEPETVFNSSEKSVALTIVNSNEATRAITDASPAENFVCADATELTVLFADANGNVKETANLAEGKNENGTYTFHELPEYIVKVGVIALRGKTAPATLAEADALWKADALDAKVDEIVVYGAMDEDEVLIQDGTCKVDHVEYPLYKGSVRVAPYQTRFEVLEFKCYDLNDAEYGYSKITLDDMIYGGVYKQDLNKVLDSNTAVATAGEGKAWSWTWAPEMAAKELLVNLTVEADDYHVAVPKKTLTITGYQDKDGKDITTFERENIYKLKVHFSEKNIDATDAYICVDVDVEIAEWVVNTITPVFGTNPTK